MGFWNKVSGSGTTSGQTHAFQAKAEKTARAKVAKAVPAGTAKERRVIAQTRSQHRGGSWGSN